MLRSADSAQHDNFALICKDESTEKRSRKDAEAQSFQSKNLRESAKSVVFSEESIFDNPFGFWPVQVKNL
jgi:hypothetical protein